MTESTGAKAGKKTLRRANGDGSIYETADGRLRGAVTWTDAAGTPQRRMVSGRTKTEVRKAVAALRAELDRGIAPPPTGTVGDFLTAWLAASRQRIRAATWKQYEQSARLYLRPTLGRLALAKMTPSDVEAMTAATIAAGRSPRTAALARAVLRRALADAVRDGRVHRNVAALARPPHVPTRALEAGRDYLDTAQLRKLLTASKVHPLGPLVTLAASTGLRQGELLGLRWSDIDEDARTLTVRRSLAVAWQGRGAEATLGLGFAEPKTPGSRRTMTLPAAALTALSRQRELQDVARLAAGTAWQDVDGLLFTDAVGRPLHGHRVTHDFHRLLTVAGLPSIPFHGLRHSAATALLAAGISMKVVSEQLGHSSIVMTADRYAGVIPAQRQQAADAMDKALGGDS
jgi:integrase